MPRIQNSEVFLPGCPDVCMASTPATLPAKALTTLPFAVCIKSDTLTVVIAPVTVNFFCTPVPVITTSSSELAADSFIVTFTTRCSFINTSTLSKPT